MAGQTENYHIYYPTDYDEIADVPENDKQQALSIEEALALIDLRNIVGDLTQLETTIKTSIVEAINELKGETDDIGDLTQLQTTIKTSVVAAINELKGKTDEIGDLTQLETTIKNDLVNAINELKTTTYNKTEIDNKISSVYKYKGTVASYSNLPSTDLTVGDVYNVESTGDNYAWTGTTWDKLGGEIDLSEYYTKTQTDNLLEGKADTEDIPDLTDYVKNTDYATSSKGGTVKISGYGIQINNGTVMGLTRTYEEYTAGSNNTIISKSTLENVITEKELVNQETLNESQASQDEIIAKLKADHPPINETGTDLSINGTGDFDLSLSPKGNIEQETTTGNQLLDIGNPDFVFTNTTYTFTNNVLNIVGTNTNYTALRYYITDLYKNNANKVLYFTFKNIDLSNYGTGNIVQLNITYNDSTPTSYVQLVNSSGTKVSHTIPADTSNVQAVEFVVCANNSSTTGNYSISITEPMLQFGTETKSYEKYTGGQASPNPNFESPVKVVDGEYGVEVENKNLANLDNVQIGKAWNNASASNRAILLISVKPNEKYTISWQDISGLDGIYVGQRTNAETVGTGVTQITSTNTQTMGTDKTVLLIQFNKSNITLSDIQVIGLQVEYSTTATPYTPHADQTQTIDTSPNPLYSENDLYFKAVNGDSFYDSLTSEQKANLDYGKWYVHNTKIKFNLSRISSFNHTSRWANEIAFSATTGINHGYSGYDNKIPLYCNRLIDDTPANIAAYKTNAIGIGGSGYTILLSIEGLTTSADYVTYFQNNETYLYLPLATPTNTKITNTNLINSLETFQNMLAYQDQTNISQTHNEAQADMIINAKTIMSMRYIESSKYDKPSGGIPKTDLASDVRNSLGKADTALQEHQDISGKQDITDNTLTTINKTVPTAINEVNSIAKLANQAKSYSTYQAFINYLNTAEKTEFIPGQSFMIQTKLVPDLWVYSVENTSVQYTYTTDEDFITYTNQATGGQVGYYKLAQLETQKVDLTDYATKTYVNNLFNSIVDGDEVSY